MVERSDADHLAYAAAQGRALYSFNRGDFLRLHALYLQEGRTHCGILLPRQQHYSVGEQMGRVLQLMAVRRPEDMQNQVEFLSAWG